MGSSYSTYVGRYLDVNLTQRCWRDCELIQNYEHQMLGNQPYSSFKSELNNPRRYMCSDCHTVVRTGVLCISVYPKLWVSKGMIMTIQSVVLTDLSRTTYGYLGRSVRSIRTIIMNRRSSHLFRMWHTFRADSWCLWQRNVYAQSKHLCYMYIIAYF